MGEHDAVVVAPRLGAEHRDVEQVAAAPGEDLLHRARARHAVADDDQTLLVRHQTSTRPRSTTIVPLTPSGAATCSSTTVPPMSPRRCAAARARSLGADGEQAHRDAVLHQRDHHELVAGVAAAEVDGLGHDAVGDRVGQFRVDGLAKAKFQTLVYQLCSAKTRLLFVAEGRKERRSPAS